LPFSVSFRLWISLAPRLPLCPYTTLFRSGGRNCSSPNNPSDFPGRRPLSGILHLMLLLISPAKTLDFETPPQTTLATQPDFLEHSQALIEELRQLSPPQVAQLMGISDKLGDLNFGRFLNWHTPFTPENAKQALLAFKGDVYTGMQAETFTKGDFTFAQKHLRILSGLYGLLRPLDLIQPYRLEMGTPFANARGKNLYQFWGDL